MTVGCTDSVALIHWRRSASTPGERSLQERAEHVLKRRLPKERFSSLGWPNSATMPHPD